jgi:hypothetical protein
VRESETREVLLDKLIGIQDLEAVKPIHDMDTDLITECTDYIIELTGDELPSESALEQMKLRLLQRLFGQKGRVLKYRKGVLRKLLIAAIVVILIVAMAVSMMPLGTNDESLMHQWAYRLLQSEQGTTVDFDDYITLINNGKIEEYKSIRQFARKTGIDILTPTILPKGYDVQNVVVSFDYLLDCPAVDIITNNPSVLSISVYLRKERINSEFDRTEQIGAYSCGLLFSRDFCQCEFCFEENCYRISAKNYEDVRLIIENMKGCIKK